jgi:tetratricopeptide (TPR) repeat protein/TolB-like protein
MLIAVVAGIAYWTQHWGSALAARRSVAVVSFRNLSGKPETAWLATALTEMLTSELGANEGIRTVPGQDVSRMRAELKLPEADGFASETLRQIRRNVGSDLVLAGSYLPVGDKIRVDIHLQQTSTGETIETITQTDEQSNLLGLVSAIGERVRTKLGLTPDVPAEKLALRASIPTNQEAIRLYSEGLERLRLFDAPAARPILERAIAADPNYPLAHAALSTAWSDMGYDSKASEEAGAALRLSDGLSREERLLVEGRSKETQSDWSKAVDVYQALWGFYPDNVEYGLLLVNAQTRAGQTKKALAVIDSLHKETRTGDPRIDLAEARASEALGDYHHGLAAAQRAENLARGRASLLLEANASLEEGNALIHLTQPLPAREAYRRARQICQSVGDRACAIAALNNEGSLLRSQGNYDGAGAIFDSALQAARETGDQRNTIKILTNMGQLARSRADLPEAGRLFDEALKTAQETGDREAVAYSLNNVGNILNNTGHPTEARQKYLECLSLARELGDQTRIAVSLGNIAILDYSEGNLAAASKGLKEALDIKRQMGDGASIAYSLGHLSNVLQLQGDVAGSRKVLQEQCKLNEQAGESIAKTHCELALAELDLSDGNVAAAEAVFRRVAGAYNTVDPAAEAWRLLATASLQTNHIQEAHEAIEKAAEIAQKSANAENFRIPIAITKARIDARLGKKAEAVQVLTENLALARSLNKVGLQLHIRLTLCQIEGPGCADLPRLEEDASRMGYGLYVSEVQLLRAGKSST